MCVYALDTVDTLDSRDTLESLETLETHETLGSLDSSDDAESVNRWPHLLIDAATPFLWISSAGIRNAQIDFFKKESNPLFLLQDAFV